MWIHRGRVGGLMTLLKLFYIKKLKENKYLLVKKLWPSHRRHRWRCEESLWWLELTAVSGCCEQQRPRHFLSLPAPPLAWVTQRICCWCLLLCRKPPAVMCTCERQTGGKLCGQFSWFYLEVMSDNSLWRSNSLPENHCVMNSKYTVIWLLLKVASCP